MFKESNLKFVKRIYRDLIRLKINKKDLGKVFFIISHSDGLGCNILGSHSIKCYFISIPKNLIQDTRNEVLAESIIQFSIGHEIGHIINNDLGWRGWYDRAFKIRHEVIENISDYDTYELMAEYIVREARADIFSKKICGDNLDYDYTMRIVAADGNRTPEQKYLSGYATMQERTTLVNQYDYDELIENEDVFKSFIEDALNGYLDLLLTRNIEIDRETIINNIYNRLITKNA